MQNKWPIRDDLLKFPHIHLIHTCAGSGKTEKLASRYIQFILSDRIISNNISNILAITFTENAAKDMKRRIITILKNLAVGESERTSRLNEYLSLDAGRLKQKAAEVVDYIIDNYSFFNVVTIDSFLLKIFNSSMRELGFTPVSELTFSYNDIIDDAFKSFIYSALKDIKLLNELDEVVDIINHTSNRFFINPLPEIVKRFKEFALKEDVYLRSIKLPDNSLSKKLLKLQSDILLTAKRLKSISGDAKMYKGVIDAIDKNDASMIANAVISTKGLSVFYQRTERTSDMELLENEIISRSIEYISLESCLYFYPYIKAYRSFFDYFNIYKRESEYVVLSNISREMDNYLNSADDRGSRIMDIYIKLSSFINHFLIDEFQDTSYPQWTMLRPLVEEAISKNGSGFFIGDIKQAIYMFRNADYEIIKEFIDKTNSDNRYINVSSLLNGIEDFSVDINYRSGKKILEYVNSFFGSNEFVSFCQDNNLNDFKDIYSVEHKSARLDDGYFKTVVIDLKNGDEEYDDDAVKKMVVDSVNELLKRHSYSSIAILTYKNDKAQEVVGWLNEENIPVASYSSMDIRKNYVISSLFSLLKFLDMPDDDFSFSSFIFSEVFLKRVGVIKRKDIDELIFNRVKDGMRRYPLYKLFREKYPEIWEEYFSELFNGTGYLSVYETVNLIYRRFQLYENFKDYSAFLFKFVDLVFNLQSSSKINSSRELIDYMEFNNIADDNEEFSIELASSLNAVNVMTFHKAKGLEFDAVINLFEKNIDSNTDTMYFAQMEDGIEVLKIKKDAASNIKNLGDVYMEKKRKDTISDINTVYVALTRARLELYNIVVKNSRSKKILELFENAEGGKKPDIKKEKKDEMPSYVEGILSDENKIIHPFIKRPDRESETEIRGRIYHRCLSLVDFVEDIRSMDEIIDLALREENVKANDSLRFEISKRLADILADPFMSGFFKTKDGRVIRNEVEIVLKDGNVLRPDRIVVDRDSVSIIDFKTGKKSSDYKEQLMKYIKAVSAIYPLKKTEGFIFYIDENSIERVNEKA
jgi:ATP-dependent helicase/nuclease subunit A